MTRWQSVPVATFATLLFIHGANIIVGFDASVIERAISRKSFVKRGRSPHDAMHEVVIAIKQLNLDVVESELLQRSTPNDPKYQQWLSYEDIGRLVANLNSAELVAQWLADNEVVATWKSQHLEYIKAQAPIEKWEILLQTKFYSWEDLTVPEGERRRTMHRALEYALPEHVASHISAVFNTVQTPPAWKPHYHTRHHSDATVTETARSLLRGEGQQSSSSPLATATATGQVTVSFLNQLYHIPSNTGSSEQQQSVFETGNEYFSSNDLRKFQQTFNLPLQGVAQDFGYDTDNCNKYDCFEGNLDVQYMMGVAQRTQMIYWYQDGTDPFIDWITAVADTSNPPLVNSISWGSTEQVQYLL